jgi:xanthine dehydrogenase YagS FAD-binding subunit
MMNRFDWVEARSVEEASALATGIVAEAMARPEGAPDAAGPALVKAGGIDLLDLMKEGMLTPVRLVNLRRLPGLDRIEEESEGGLAIGALTTLEALAAHPLIRARYAALAQAAGQSASPQIRHVATIGGNLLQRPRCWYFRSADHHCARKGGPTCFAFSGENQYHAIFGQHGCAIVHPSTAATALVALDAELSLQSAAGATRRVRLEQFLVPPEIDLTRENDLKPGEILTAVHLPPLGAARSAHLKLAEKASFDWPLADVAVVLDLDAQKICRRAAVVLGAAAPVPHRAKSAEAALAGQAIGEASARAAAEAAMADATPLAKNGYKLPIFKTLIRRAVLAAAGA